MKLRISITIVIIALICSAAYAGKKRTGTRSIFKTTVAVVQEDDYDVQYVQLNIQGDNLSTAIVAKAITVAKVVAPQMSDYYFELSDQLTIDSAILNGQPVSVTTINPYLKKITLNTALSQNSIFTAEIYYHGAPTGGTGFFTNGLLHQTGVVPVTHTISAAVHSRDWWPCKQSLTDKIDSADIMVTVPPGLKVAGNGLLRSVVTLPSGKKVFHWSTRNPIDYYLISFAIAPYSEYSYFMHFTNSSDSMLVQNYIYDSLNVMQQHKDELDSIALVINYFSDLFGRYPFDNEKFGTCLAPISGGMENQTMVSLGSLDMPLIAHELSHQWWGNNVTCASLHDMWLNEGWANYCEQLFVEHFWTTSQLLYYRNTLFNNVLSSVGGTVYVDDTTSEARIYSGRLTYDKGGAVAHMLRYYINNDSVFFSILRAYHQQYRFATATTTDLKNIASQISGVQLDTFFQHWIYGEGYPVYSVKWFQSGSQVKIRLTQTTSYPGSVPLFKIPIELKLSSAQGDTIVRLDNNHPIETYTLNWAPTVTSLSVDPNNHILNRTGPIIHDSSWLELTESEIKPVEVFPNPSSSGWQVRNLGVADLVVTDILGKVIWTATQAKDSAFIPGSNLQTGNYLLTIITKQGTETLMLVR